MFLTTIELADLTGRKQKTKQIQQLISMQIPFTIDAHGWPKVLEKTLEIEMGGVREAKVNEPQSINFNKLSMYRGG